MRVTRAGSCETILWSWLAVLLGSSTVLMIWLVTSGSVEMVVTFLRISTTRACEASAAKAAVGAALTEPMAETATVVDIREASGAARDQSEAASRHHRVENRGT